MNIQICFVTHIHVEQHDSLDERGVFLFSSLPAGCCKEKSWWLFLSKVCLCLFACVFVGLCVNTHTNIYVEKIIRFLEQWYVKFPIYLLTKELLIWNWIEKCTTCVHGLHTDSNISGMLEQWKQSKNQGKGKDLLSPLSIYSVSSCPAFYCSTWKTVVEE